MITIRTAAGSSLEQFLTLRFFSQVFFEQVQLMLLTWLYTPSFTKLLTRIQIMHSNLNYAAHLCLMHAFCVVFIFDHNLDLIQIALHEIRIILVFLYCPNQASMSILVQFDPCDLSELCSGHCQWLFVSIVESVFIHQTNYKLYRSSVVPVSSVEYFSFIS